MCRAKKTPKSRGSREIGRLTAGLLRRCPGWGELRRSDPQEREQDRGCQRTCPAGRQPRTHWGVTSAHSHRLSLSAYQEPIGKMGLHGKGRSIRPSFVILRATFAPAGTVVARLRVAEIVTLPPVFTSTGNGCTSTASIDPRLVSAPSVWNYFSVLFEQLHLIYFTIISHSPQKPYSSWSILILLAETRTMVDSNTISFILFADLERGETRVIW